MFNPELQNDVYTNPEDEIFIPQEEIAEVNESSDFNGPIEIDDGFVKEPTEITLQNEEELSMIAKMYNVNIEDLIRSQN